MEQRCDADAMGRGKKRKKGACRMPHAPNPLKEGFGAFQQDAFYMKISQREAIKESFLLVQGSRVSHGALTAFIQTAKNKGKLSVWVPALSRLHRWSQKEDNRQKR